MGGAAPGLPGIAQMPGMPGQGQPAGSEYDSSDPLATLMAQFSKQGQPAMGTSDPLGKESTKPLTLLQKLLPLLHLFSVWILLAYFVFWKEPKAVEAVSFSMGEGRNSLPRRWAELVSGSGRDGWGVETVVSVNSHVVLGWMLTRL